MSVQPPRPIASRLIASVVAVAVACSSCASVDVVRIQPGTVKVPKGMEVLAGIQAVSMGFYFFTLGIPEADLDKTINEMLLKKAKALGADKVINLRFDVTPSHGIWFLTKLFWWRVATAWGVAVVEQKDDKNDPDMPPMDAARHPASAPTSSPASSQPAPK